MARKDHTEIVVVLDRSGSMHCIALDMEGGFDAFVADQRKLPGTCDVTLTQFDDKYEIVYAGKALADVPPLKLEARGSTALFDAIGRTIVATGERLDKLSEADRPERVLFVVITDGFENASKEFSRDKVVEMIKHQTDKYSWCFVYIGANQDAIAAAQSFGMAHGVNFDANAVGVENMTRNLAGSTSRYRRGQGYS